MTRHKDDLRHERKIVAPETFHQHLLHWIHIHRRGFISPFPPRQISNVYFDTYDFVSYRETLAGIALRRKVRFRWYGSSPTPAAGQLEVKIKHGLVGRKLTYPVDQDLYHGDMSWRSFVARLDSHLPPDGRRWLHEYPQPVLINRYTRHYFRTPDGKVRITVDHRLRAWDQRYKPSPNVSRGSNLPRSVVVEIKCTGEHLAVAAQLMGSLPFSVSKNSKYCTALQASHGF